MDHIYALTRWEVNRLLGDGSRVHGVSKTAAGTQRQDWSNHYNPPCASLCGSDEVKKLAGGPDSVVKNYESCAVDGAQDVTGTL